MPRKMVETSIYLQVEPEWSSYKGADGEPELRGIKVAKILQRRPRRINGVGVKLTLKLPAAAFKPLSPTIVVEVPENALDYEPEITVDIPDRD